jgi:hypothetical protein
MGYDYKDGYKRNVKPKAFSLPIEMVDKLQEYEEINWSKVVTKLLARYLDQLDQMEDVLKVGEAKDEG